MIPTASSSSPDRESLPVCTGGAAGETGMSSVPSEVCRGIDARVRDPGQVPLDEGDPEPHRTRRGEHGPHSARGIRQKLAVGASEV